MATIFRTYKTKLDPATGLRVRVLDAKGRPVPHARYRFEYLDHAGRRRSATGTASKGETEKLAGQIELREMEIKRGLRPVPRSADKAAVRSFGEMVAEYMSWGETQGGRGGRPWGATHMRMRRSHLAWWGERLGPSYPGGPGRGASKS